MSVWPRIKIKDLGKVVTGKTPSTKAPENFNGPYPFITIPDLDGQVYIRATERTISTRGADLLHSCLLPSNAVMMSCIATVGKCGIATKSSFTNQQINSVICNEKVEPRYLYYCFSQLKFQLEAAGGGGSVYTNVSKSRFSELEVPFPPSPEQRAIAAILGALDDKIELNHQMNQTLEAMAQALFKSWFVDFEPFRDQGMEESPLGPIPSGWRVGELSKLCSTQYGYTASATDEPVGPHLLRVTDINKQNWVEWTSVPYCQIEERDKPKYALDVGDVVVARMADPGKSTIIEQPINAVFASYLVRLKTASLAHAYYVYGFLKSRAYAEYAEGAMGGSSVQKSMNARVIVDTNLVIPPIQTLESFLKYLLPLRKRLVANVEQSASLATIRDILMSKLLSGQIRVKDAEKFVERVA